jgi:BlaI family penicillinase repressor
MKINHLTAAEEIVMKVLWNLDSAYMKDIIAEYPEPKPHANTVSTFLKILVEKSFLTTEKEGRIFRYRVAVPLEDYRKFLLDCLIENYYNNSPEELIHSISTPADKDSELLTKTNGKSPNDSLLSQFLEDITTSKKKKKKKKNKKLKLQNMEQINIKVKKNKK